MKQAMIFAAGLGTRLKPLTDTMPKAHQIIDYLKSNDHFGIDIRISDERDGLLETGGGIKKALPLFDTESPILIHNVDILSNLDISQLTDVSTPPDALLVVSRRQTKRYLLFDDEMILDGWTNIATGEVRSPYPGLDPSDLKQLAFSGIHVLWPRVFPLFSEMPERFGIINKLKLLSIVTCQIVNSQIVN